MAGRDTEFTINLETGELMVHVHGEDAVGYDAVQALLEKPLGRATRIDKRVKADPRRVQRSVQMHRH